MAISIYLVEDHPLIQRVLHEALHRLLKLHVCGVATTAHEALTQIPGQCVDLVLVDVSLPDMNGIELVKLLHAQQPTLPCVMLSGHQELSYVQRALAVGARGYIAKGNPLELKQAIGQVLAGTIYLSEPLRQSTTGKLVADG